MKRGFKGAAHSHLCFLVLLTLWTGQILRLFLGRSVTSTSNYSSCYSDTRVEQIRVPSCPELLPPCPLSGELLLGAAAGGVCLIN